MKMLLLVLLACTSLFCTNQSQSNASQTSNVTLAANQAEELTLSLSERSAKTGELVCMDVQVNGFEKLLSMQYTLSWNQNVLTFKELKNFALPHMDINDFGTTRTQEGMLTLAWIDDSLKGTTLPDGTSAYQVCFIVKGTSGQSSYFKITDRPTPIEVVNLKEKIIPLKKKAGKMTVL